MHGGSLKHGEGRHVVVVPSGRSPSATNPTIVVAARHVISNALPDMFRRRLSLMELSKSGPTHIYGDDVLFNSPGCEGT